MGDGAERQFIILREAGEPPLFDSLCVIYHELRAGERPPGEMRPLQRHVPALGARLGYGDGTGVHVDDAAAVPAHRDVGVPWRSMSPSLMGGRLSVLNSCPWVRKTSRSPRDMRA